MNHSLQDAGCAALVDQGLIVFHVVNARTVSHFRLWSEVGIISGVHVKLQNGFLVDCITEKTVSTQQICILQDMPEIKRWDEGSKEIIAEMLTGSTGDWIA